MLPTPQEADSGRGRGVLPDPFYYLNNFKAVLASLAIRYGALLTSEEFQFFRQFALLPQPSCALLVRMIMRVGMFFRARRLVYPEIGDTAAPAAPLLGMGWLDEPALDVPTLHRLLTKTELAAHLPLPRDLRRLNKRDLLEALRARHAEPRPLAQWCARLDDRVFRPTVKPLAERLRVMFFGNFRQDWTQFVLSDLGISSYEKIPAHSAPFCTRAQIDAFHQLYRCQMALQEGAPLEEIVADIPARIADSDWLEEKRQRLLFQVGRAYERLGEHESAGVVFSSCLHRGARMRAARSLERSQDWRAARELCLAARADPESGAERQQVPRLLTRLNRKLGISDDAHPERCRVATFDVQLEPSDGRALEFQMRDHLARQEEAVSSVHYVENGLINSLFGLLCWDAIFAPIPGAFFHDYQPGPADLESPYFYERRRRHFAECFAELESGRYKETIRRRLRAKAGIQAPFVAWGLLSSPLLDEALECFPAPHLRLWFEWIVRDVVDNRTGFPDLVQFWPGEGRYRLVEVKGPGDRLQDNQRRFLEFCAERRMHVAVCRVRLGAC